MNDIKIKIADNLYNEFISVLNQLKQEDSIRKSKRLVFQLLIKFNEYNRFIVANQMVYVIITLIFMTNLKND